MTAPGSNDPYPAHLPAAKTGTWEDALDIFYAPIQVFNRRRDGKYWVPLIILCVLSVAIYFLSIQYNEAVADAEFTRAMAQQATKGQKLTPEQLAQGKAFADKIKGLIVYMMPVLLVISAWVSGVILMLLANMMGGKLNFAQGATIGVLANFPEMLGRVVVGIQGMFLDTAAVNSKYAFATSVARFMSPDGNKFLLKLGALADPFVIWSAVLVGVGVFVIGRVEKEKAAVLAIIHAIGFALIAR
jgi:Yip1 domain